MVPRVIIVSFTKGSGGTGRAGAGGGAGRTRFEERVAVDSGAADESSKGGKK